MPGMGEVIYKKGYELGFKLEYEEGFKLGYREEYIKGQNDLIMAIRRMQNGETREELLEAGTDEHTLELAESVFK